MSSAGPQPPADDPARLVAGLLDGTLTPDEESALGRLLASDPEVRRRYLEDADLHATLFGDDPAVALPDPPGAEAARPAGAVRRWRSGRRVAAVVAAVAAAVLAAVWAATRPPAPAPGGAGPEPSPPETRVVELAGRADVQTPSGGSDPAAVGTALQPGQTIHTGPDDSAAVLAMPDGTRLELGPDTRVRWAEAGGFGGPRLVLSAGLLRAVVAPQPPDRPLVVVTREAEVRVIGTVFSVAAVDGVTAVETESGLVRMLRLSDGSPADVPAGFSAVAAETGPPVVARPVRRAATEPRARAAVGRVTGLAFTPAAVVAAGPRQWAAFDPASLRPLGKPAELTPDGHDALVSADGGAVVVTGPGGRLLRYDTRAGGPPTDLGAIRLPVVGVSGDGAVVAAAPAAADVGPKGPWPVQVWGAAAGAGRPGLRADGTVRALALDAAGRTLAVATVRPGGPFSDRRVTVWDGRTGKRVATTGPLSHTVVRLAVSADGSRVAGAEDQGAVHLWDAPTGAWVATRRAADGWVCRVRVLGFSPDGRLLAAGGTDGRVRVWDTATGADRVALATGRRAVAALAFAPDSRSLAVGTTAGQVTVWDLPPDTP